MYVYVCICIRRQALMHMRHIVVPRKTLDHTLFFFFWIREKLTPRIRETYIQLGMALIAVHTLWMSSKANLTPWTQFKGNHPPGQSINRALFPHDIITSTITPPGYLIKLIFTPLDTNVCLNLQKGKHLNGVK